MASSKSFRLHYKQCHFKPKHVPWYVVRSEDQSESGQTSETLVWLHQQTDNATLREEDIEGTYLRVVVQKATSLLNMDYGFSDKSDPYCSLHLNGATGGPNPDPHLTLT